MKYAYVIAAFAAGTMAMSASAQTLTSATVRGLTGSVPSGTVWTAGDPEGTDTGNYTLFLQTPALGSFLNPNDEAISLVPTLGENRVFLAGDGFPLGTNTDSDATYQLVLGFDGGQSLTGTYTPFINTFVPLVSSFVDGGRNYTLSEFSFRRFLGNPVGPYSAVAGTGDGNDYVGNFRISAATVAAVPEPATWAMMIGGFSIVGFALRRRRTNATRVLA